MEFSSDKDKELHNKAVLAACKAQHAAKRNTVPYPDPTAPSLEILQALAKSTESARQSIKAAEMSVSAHQTREDEINTQMSVLAEERRLLREERALALSQIEQERDTLKTAHESHLRIRRELDELSDTLDEISQLEQSIKVLEAQVNTQAAQPEHHIPTSTSNTRESASRLNIAFSPKHAKHRRSRSNSPGRTASLENQLREHEISTTSNKVPTRFSPRLELALDSSKVPLRTAAHIPFRAWTHKVEYPGQSRVRHSAVPYWNKNTAGEYLIPTGEFFCRANAGTDNHPRICAHRKRFNSRSELNAHAKRHGKVYVQNTKLVVEGQTRAPGGAPTLTQKNIAAAEFAKIVALMEAAGMDSDDDENSSKRAVEPTVEPAKKRRRTNTPVIKLE